MTYQETLDYLFKKLPMFSRIGADAFKKDLTNIAVLCRYLGNPQNRFKSIHIGGTNGKGSVSHMLAAVLQTAGYKTGLNTSPHLYDFRERIKINGMMVPEDFVVHFVERIKPLIKEIAPSFFEITVAMAFHYFAQQEVDVAVIEVGLGGRLDSTNIIHPEVAVITNISYDHTNMLGNTLEEIAGEKGGIIKPNTPVIIGERQPETDAVFTAVAAQKEAPIFFAQDCFTVSHFSSTPTVLQLEVRNKQSNGTQKYILDLPGIYQTKNIITVLKTIDILQSAGWKIGDDAIQKGAQNVKSLTGLSGRWEVIGEQPYVILEVAHNEEGIRQMLHHVAGIAYHQLHLIYGTVKDKDFAKILQLLPQQAHYYFTKAHIPRALDAELLQEEARKYNLTGNVFDDVNKALQQALSKAAPDDLIIVCGSIFLVAEVDKSRFQ